MNELSRELVTWNMESVELSFVYLLKSVASLCRMTVVICWPFEAATGAERDETTLYCLQL